MNAQPSVILLVEDNSAHAELVLRTIEDNRLATHVHHVCDGEAALDYLYQRAPYDASKGSPRPHLVLLDLRLPRIDGLDVLKKIKSSDALKTIPVIVLTTSKSEIDAARAYENRANSYLVKPLDFGTFEQMMKQLGSYWLHWNYCPW